MRIHNIYADENGETHFRDIDIEMTEYGPDGPETRAAHDSPGPRRLWARAMLRARRERPRNRSAH